MTSRYQHITSPALQPKLIEMIRQGMSDTSIIFTALASVEDPRARKAGKDPRIGDTLPRCGWDFRECPA